MIQSFIKNFRFSKLNTILNPIVHELDVFFIIIIVVKPVFLFFLDLNWFFYIFFSLFNVLILKILFKYIFK
jgi:hypothetical protein